jgi:dTDP-4-amino-4,6-dideoxygalactose transaminase
MSEHGFIPFSLPSIGPEEAEEVMGVLRSGWLTTGAKTAQFEEEFRSYVRSPYALAVNSATAGLHLALASLNIGSGDEVITTPLTFCATINTILQVGATPVLADVGADGNIDPCSIAERITSRTRAIIPVHLGGLPCEMDVISGLARDHGLSVIEDAAHAAGSAYRGIPIGCASSENPHASDAVVFSFYATKNMTTGEGGMITTGNAALADTMRVLCLHGISRDAWNRYSADGNWFYEVVRCGFKYNLTDIQSAIGIHQIRKLERFLEARTSYAELYNKAFAELAELETPPVSASARHAWHLYALRLNLARLRIDRAEFIRQLRIRNIGSSVHFIPITLHPYFAERAREARNRCPRALEFYPRLISLPLYPAMTEEDVAYVISAVRQIVVAYRKSTMITARGGIRPGAAPDMPDRRTAALEPAGPLASGDS